VTLSEDRDFLYHSIKRLPLLYVQLLSGDDILFMPQEAFSTPTVVLPSCFLTPDFIVQVSFIFISPRDPHLTPRNHSHRSHWNYNFYFNNVYVIFIYEGSTENINKPFYSIKYGKLHDWLSDYQLLKASAPWTFVH
jgi:hypothetical protein